MRRFDCLFFILTGLHEKVKSMKVKRNNVFDVLLQISAVFNAMYLKISSNCKCAHLAPPRVCRSDRSINLERRAIACFFADNSCDYYPSILKHLRHSYVALFHERLLHKRDANVLDASRSLHFRRFCRRGKDSFNYHRSHGFRGIRFPPPLAPRPSPLATRRDALGPLTRRAAITHTHTHTQTHMYIVAHTSGPRSQFLCIKEA
jgi:hypothetical protein